MAVTEAASYMPWTSVVPAYAPARHCKQQSQDGGRRGRLVYGEDTAVDADKNAEQKHQ